MKKKRKSKQPNSSLRRALKPASAGAVSQSQALQYLGMMQARNNDLAGAAQYFEQARQFEPRNAQLLNNLGYFYQQLAESQKSLACYEEALALEPGVPLTLCNLGLLHKHLGNLTAALMNFERALVATPDDTALLCNRANILLEQGNAASALADANRAASLEPKNPAVLNTRANILTDMLRYDEALTDLNQAIERRPQYARAWSNRGDVYRDIDQSERAIKDYQQALKLAPDDAATQANLAGLYLTRPHHSEAAIQASEQSLHKLLVEQFAPQGASVARLRANGVSVFRLKHDLGQALFLRDHTDGLAADTREGLDAFIATAQSLISSADPSQRSQIPLSPNQLELLCAYWRQPWQAKAPLLAYCLNPENDWPALEQRYLDGKPEILTIDHFLAPAALAAMQHYCLASKVWVREYPNQYLGAFANQGFAQPLHFQLARELQQMMPRVFKGFALNQLWGFKYDTMLGKGINIHADFAKVNLNFWITPDEHNLDNTCGGLKVYETPAPADWTFHDYNSNSQAIYDHLAKHDSASQTITYRCNRAVLFNSALFHETDRIQFADGYRSRRINITYLFGKQLR
ncbi:MAG: tetratricopeptide repeat protein [Burkholderiaceae bacterium]